MEIKPVLKWVGGKRQLLPELTKRMPPTYKTYCEAFIGGGALLFDRYDRYTTDMTDIRLK